MDDFIFLLTEKEAKYKQVYQQIKALIMQGSLQTDDSLPSIRKLADTLQVSRNTTLTAYEQLVAEGYIRGEGRKGYFVNALEQVFLKEQEQPLRHSQKEGCILSCRFSRWGCRSATFSHENMAPNCQSSITGINLLRIWRTVWRISAKGAACAIFTASKRGLYNERQYRYW